MILRLIREPTDAGATLGALYANGVWMSWTLEDAIRELPGVPVSDWKIRGKTAIPAGTYRVQMSWSPRFQRVLPEVLGVPGFTGIRIHPGNTIEDTDGCILIGFQRAHATVTHSRPAVDHLIASLEQEQSAGREVWLTIQPPMDTR